MDRRTEILRRAAELFERDGVSNTSLEDIAGEIGVKREAIYYYFKSRTDILAEILLPQSELLLSNITNIRRTDMTNADKLREAIRNHLSSFNPTYLEMTVALREHHFGADSEKLKRIRKTWKAYGEHWNEIVEEGQKKGEFNPALNAKVVAFGILGMCNWLSRWFDPSKQITIEEIIEIYFTMVSNGLMISSSEIEE